MAVCSVKRYAAATIIATPPHAANGANRSDALRPTNTSSAPAPNSQARVVVTKKATVGSVAVR